MLYQKKYNKKIRLKINWKNFVSFMVTNETYMDKIFHDLSNRDNPFRSSLLFKIIDSEYIKRLSHSSGTFIDYMTCVHFVVLTSDAVIDIIAEHEPTVELVNT